MLVNRIAPAVIATAMLQCQHEPLSKQPASLCSMAALQALSGSSQAHTAWCNVLMPLNNSYVLVALDRQQDFTWARGNRWSDAELAHAGSLKQSCSHCQGSGRS